MGQRTEIVEVELPGGDVVLVEAIDRGGDVAAFDRLKLDEARASVARIGAWAVDSVREGLREQPQRVSVELGLKLAVKSGRLVGVLAEAGGEASVVLRMEWDRAPGG